MNCFSALWKWGRTYNYLYCDWNFYFIKNVQWFIVQPKTLCFPLNNRGENYAELRKQAIQESKYLGGDMEHTHLVKGLDYALLEKVCTSCLWVVLIFLCVKHFMVIALLRCVLNTTFLLALQEKNSLFQLWILVKNPWVHGLNKSRVPSHKGDTIYRVAM